MTNPIRLLPDPDKIGQCEYRVIYDALKDTLEDCPKEERMELAIAMLDEFEGWAKDIREKLTGNRSLK